MTYVSTSHQFDARARIRRIGMEDLRQALKGGWADYLEKRGDPLIIGFIYPVVGLLAALITARTNLLPVLFPLVMGLALVGPLVASGFYEIARRRERGEDPSWRCFFEPFFGPARYAILTLGLMLAVLFTLWLTAAWGIYEATVGRLTADTAGAFVGALFTTPEGWTMIGAGLLVGAIFAAAALAISVISFPMVLDRGGRPYEALIASIEATAKNWRAIGAWGLIVIAILAVASIPLFVGLAVALPVLGYATWRLYTRVVER